ncbi:MAG: hypothetical protein R2824_10555 [Saprospiraceae bacterium]
MDRTEMEEVQNPEIETNNANEGEEERLQQLEKNRDFTEGENELVTISTTLSVEEISFGGLKFKGTKSALIELMGKPDSIVEPKYECGPFSEDSQGMKFYQYYYGGMNFIVYQALAEIQNINFSGYEVLKISGKEFTQDTDFDTALEKLGIVLNEDNYSKDQILIYPEEPLDEHYILKFENGKLHQFDRFEPC